ncbi:hypothetical protein IE077_003546 [Cardiosporidium cionae]|uniref:Uncharacterized protein n=1 Tax=Cardiosporidium cionae TaxID=476202 RepID=A0ABQ7J806_9APIC|nr:hypothetical protein IE077_003546 [Cardiosporidium cionae]|eukprot:KAF8820121.1 hypothetical protein IE077_003546 [Cardiosporidium cionae]
MRNGLGSFFFRLSSARYAGGAAKPQWTIPQKQMWHPQIPDRQHYGEHQTYNGFVLWLRGIRPYLEKIFGDVITTGKRWIFFFTSPIPHFVRRHNPDIRLDVSTAVELGVAKDLDMQGFWQSHSEDTEKRLQDYSSDCQRLNELWENALSDASTSRSFDTLVKHLAVDESAVPEGIPLPISWRFNMLPYGRDNPATRTFPVPSHEQPLRAVALNFTYNNLSGSWGDYINRQDNKSAPLRHARTMFTDAYIPGTK